MRLLDAVVLRIESLLSERGLTKYQLCKIGRINYSTLKKLTNLKSNTALMNTIYQICSTLEISLVEFFDDELFDYENLED